MKTQSDFLFRLIKSLTPSEKRYFKVFAQQKKGKHSVQLFEAMDKQKVYDEEKLKKKLGNASWVKHFSMAKTRLKQLLLNCLYEYQNSNTLREQIRESFQQAWVLFFRGFYEEGLAMIRKILKQCEEAELHALAIYICRNSIYLLSHAKLGTFSDLNLLAKIDLYSNRILQENEMIHIDSQMATLVYRKNIIRQEEDRLFFQKLMQSPILHLPNKDLTDRSLILKYIIHYMYYGRVVRNQEKAFEVMQSGVDLFSAKKILTIESAQEYYTFLINYLNACGVLAKYEELYAGIERLDSLLQHKVFQKGIINLEAVTFTQKIRLLLSAYNQQKQFDKSLALLPDAMNGLKRYKKRINVQSHVSLTWLIMMTYWVFERYDAILDWLNYLFDLRVKEVHTATFSAARILNLIVHYELGNHYYLEYGIDSTNRYLYKKGDLTPVETCIIKYFRRIVSLDDSKRVQNVFVDFKQNLMNLLKNHGMLIVMDALLVWLDAKIEGRTMKEIAERG